MIKKGIKVKILCGKDKKKEGDVIEIDRSKKRVKRIIVGVININNQTTSSFLIFIK